jgi:hypothetical protein
MCRVCRVGRPFSDDGPRHDPSNMNLQALRGKAEPRPPPALRAPAKRRDSANFAEQSRAPIVSTQAILPLDVCPSKRHARVLRSRSIESAAGRREFRASQLPIHPRVA